MVDDIRLGRGIRAIRHRLDWRQDDLASRAKVSQDAVSRAERGKVEEMTLRRLRSITGALDAELVVMLRWRGGDLDRLLDEGHATVLGAIVRLLEAYGWQVAAEVSYAVFSERGSVDLLAWHEASRCLLVVEIKTDLVSVEATLRKHDEKVRLAGRIAAERFGWSPAAIARMLVLPDTSTARRRVARHAAVLDAAYPIRSDALRQWLQAPVASAGSVSGLLFAPNTRGTRGIQRRVTRKRIRRRRASEGRS